MPRAPRTRQPGCAARAAGCDATRIERVREHAKSATKVGSDKGLIEGSVFEIAAASSPPTLRRAAAVAARSGARFAVNA